MVKRYMAHFPEPDFKESEHGGWVKLADYAALEARCREAEARVPLKGGIPLAQYVLQQRVAELEEVLRQVNGRCSMSDSMRELVGAALTASETKPVYKCGACEDSGWLWDVNKKVPCDVCEAGSAWLHAQVTQAETICEQCGNTGVLYDQLNMESECKFCNSAAKNRGTERG